MACVDYIFFIKLLFFKLLFIKVKLENRVPGNGCYHNLATTTEAFENIIPSSGCSGDMNFFLVRGIPPRDVREKNAFKKMVVFDVCCTVSNQKMSRNTSPFLSSSSFIETRPGWQRLQTHVHDLSI